MNQKDSRPAGHLTSSDAIHVVPPHLQTSKSDHSEVEHSKGAESISSYESPSAKVALIIIPADVKSSPKENVNGSLATVYCSAFSKDLRRCLCNVRRYDIEVRTYRTSYPPSDTMDRNGREMSRGKSGINGKARGDTVREHKEGSRSNSNTPCSSHSAVTLIAATTIKAFRRGTLDLMLESWCGPKVGLQ